MAAAVEVAVGDRQQQDLRYQHPFAGACASSVRMQQGRPGCFGRKGKAADRDGPRSWNTDKMARCWMQMEYGDRPCKCGERSVDERQR